MLNKMYIILTLIGAYEVNTKFEPNTYTRHYDEVTQMVVNEYESACLRKTVHLSGKGYTCNDLKHYIYKRGYKSFD